jgi:hypothetical protein
MKKYCDKCGSVFVCSCDGKPYIPGGFRYNSRWPFENNGRIRETYQPEPRLRQCLTIPQLLDQAEQMRNASRPERKNPTLSTWISETISDIVFHLWRFNEISKNYPKGDYDAK